MHWQQNIEKKNKAIAEWLFPEMLDKENIKEKGLEISDNMFLKMCVYLEDYKNIGFNIFWDRIMVAVEKINASKNNDTVEILKFGTKIMRHGSPLITQQAANNSQKDMLIATFEAVHAYVMLEK